MAKTKKVDVKKVEKMNVNKLITDLLYSAGISVSDGVDYGFTEGTIVAHMENCDVQIKLITPKAGVTRYPKLEDMEEEVEE